MLMNALILDVAWYQIIRQYTLSPNKNNKYTGSRGRNHSPPTPSRQYILHTHGQQTCVPGVYEDTAKTTSRKKKYIHKVHNVRDVRTDRHISLHLYYFTINKRFSFGTKMHNATSRIS